jgi:hypothetical protein
MPAIARRLPAAHQLPISRPPGFVHRMQPTLPIKPVNRERCAGHQHICPMRSERALRWHRARRCSRAAPPARFVELDLSLLRLLPHVARTHECPGEVEARRSKTGRHKARGAAMESSSSSRVRAPEPTDLTHHYTYTRPAACWRLPGHPVARLGEATSGLGACPLWWGTWSE